MIKIKGRYCPRCNYNNRERCEATLAALACLRCGTTISAAEDCVEKFYYISRFNGADWHICLSFRAADDDAADKHAKKYMAGAYPGCNCYSVLNDKMLNIANPSNWIPGGEQ